MAQEKPAALAEEARIVQLIVLRVGDEEFGVPIEQVREIVKTGAITPIPDSPAFIRGLVNVRGDIVATIDLRARFALPADQTAAKHIVLTKQEESLFGLMVDEVTEVLRIPASEIKAPHKLMTQMQEDYVSGVVTLGQRLIILLDLARVLSMEELAHLSEVTREHREMVNAESATVQPADAAAETKAPRKQRRRK